MSKNKGKLRFKLADLLIRKFPDCPKCHGRGWIVTSVQLDKMTWMDKDDFCPSCDGYGKRLNGIARAIINLVPD